VASPGSCILALAGGQRRGEIGFGRFLRNPAVTVAGLSEAAGRHTAERVGGRDVLAIQDTSEITLGVGKKRAEGYGVVGKGGNLSGVLLHPVLAVDAASGELFGLVDIAAWNRSKPKALPHGQRASDDKESQRWLTGMERAADVLKDAARITVVADRESDIYQDFARRPKGVHLLVRAGFDRRLATGEKLFDHAASLAEASRFTVNIPPAQGGLSGRAGRQATLALRFGPVTILRPHHGLPPDERKKLAPGVELYLVDICEVVSPQGSAPIHWRLLTSHCVKDIGTARKMLDFYRKRWIIEEYFRTLKTAGFRIEDAEISDPKVMLRFTALAAIAAITVTQLLRSRDNPSGQSMRDAFDPDDEPLIEAVCKDYEGSNPTKRQTNPYPNGTLAYATWVIARLGGWTGYYGKPGSLNISRGLQKYHAIKYGTQIERGFV
jgi:Transposase DDE domain